MPNHLSSTSGVRCMSVVTRFGRRVVAEGGILEALDPTTMAFDARSQPVRYAVAFRIGSAPTAAGALVVDRHAFRLDGRSAADRFEMSFADLREVRVGRRAEERLGGYATLVLTRVDGLTIQVEPLGAGLLHELADLLAGLADSESKSKDQVIVTVPLRKNAAPRVRALVAEGPPFDPGALGLVRHDVFVADDEAVFLFEGPNARDILERATRDPSLWRVLLTWRGCVAGRPRLTTTAEHSLPAPEQRVYSWSLRNAAT